MDKRLEVGTTVLANVVYCLAVVAVLIMFMPQARASVTSLWARQRHAWQYGRWLGRQPPPPAWLAQIGRQDLPDEAVT